jgi:hypothetical protein
VSSAITERVNEQINQNLDTNRSSKIFAIGEKKPKLQNFKSRKSIKKNYSEDLNIM